MSNRSPGQDGGQMDTVLYAEDGPLGWLILSCPDELGTCGH
jgi:hypothetical protein